ncbi:hypothetical protein DL764_004528 [Monosporascus ibericus]|uniref:Dystroglycan-type cadherin-like domain-containing protein n=1 Tax=Monosporascus ibericus TaxID=155417 RepID=A0A4Q4TCE4_9PEZI|nr:hypothetical protein DL764_004528 [Monosporascus ibericus]
MVVAAGRALPGQLLLLAGVVLLIEVAGAVPVDYFPFNSQLPPVARAAEPFSFVFSPLTFSSPYQMTYSLRGAPAWLSVDSDARRLFGTPGDEYNGDDRDKAVVGIPFELVARDSMGAAAVNVMLVVSRNRAPAVEVPLAEQIAAMGAYSAPSSLLLYPSSPFSFTFAKGTFHASNDEVSTLNYYAVSGNNAPLPSWMSFDMETLTFSGMTPPFESLVQPPQTFGFQLVASDVVGFSGVSVPFSIVVRNHELTVDEAVVKLNASHGKPFEYGGLPETLKMDKRPLSPEEITSIEAFDLPEWLGFNTETWKLSGTPDATAESSNVTIAMVNKYADTLNVTLIIEMNTKIFVSDLPDIYFTTGEDLSFDLKQYLFDPQGIDIYIESQPESPWINLDSASKKLSGTAPEPRAVTYATDITIIFQATLKRSNDTDTRTMILHLVDPSATGPTPEPTTAPAPKDVDDDTSRRNVLWLLLPFLLLICAIAILALFYLRRRRHHIAKMDIMEVSASIPGSFVNHGSAGSSLQDMRKMLDIGPPGTANAGLGTGDSAHSSSYLRVAPGPRATVGLQPHALTSYGDRRHSRSEGALVQPRYSWSARQPGKMDERGLLSDTSLGEGDLHVAEVRLPGLARTTHDPYGNKLTLDVPVVSEPFSIQPTPEMAYKPPRRRYNLSSSEDGVSSASSPIVGFARSYNRPRSGMGLELGVSNRLSRMLKRVSGQSGEKRSRHSNFSSSTNQTTRTSILTTALAEQAATTTRNTVLRPTIVHIPSRLGEARQVSRRIDDSTPLFSGRSLTRLQRNINFRNETAQGTITDGIPGLSPFPQIYVATARDSDTPRDPLGTAHKDLTLPTQAQGESAPRTREPFSAPPEEPNWKASCETQKPTPHNRWAQSSADYIGTAIGDQSSWNKPLHIPLLTPVRQREPPETQGKGKGKASTGTATPGPEFKTPSSRPTHRRQRSRVLDGFRAVPTIAQITPSPPPNKALPQPPTATITTTTRPLPETPTPADRRPLMDRLTESLPRNKSVRSVASEDKGHGKLRDKGSVAKGNEEDVDDGDEDVWEDIRPPNSTFGRGDWEGDWSEGGSFAVYI